jgi:hypothetical protein
MSPADKPTDKPRSRSAPNSGEDNPAMQGEGNYVAGRRYDQAQQEFVEAGKVDDAARKAKPTNTREAEEMDAAEQEGRSHAKGEDPALRRGGR